MGSARASDRADGSVQGADCAPLTARAKGFEAKADMIHLIPMPEEARRRFFFAGSTPEIDTPKRATLSRPARASRSSQTPR